MKNANDQNFFNFVGEGLRQRVIRYYLKEESKKECREETAQNKADKLLTSLQRVNQSRRQEKKLS